MMFQPSYDLLLAEALAAPARPGRSKLERYRATICELRRKGWTFAQIANWLKERGVGATTSNVHRFFSKVKCDYAPSLN
jgi:transposase